MSATYRWYRVSLPKSIPNICRLLSKHFLTPSDEFGFLSLGEEGRIPKLRFLWRTKVHVIRLDEEGAPVSEEFASVSFIDFGVIRSDSDTYLRLENPGHGSRSLFNALETIIGFGFTCEPIRFQLSKSVDIFEGVDVAKLTGLSVSGAVVHQDLVARLEFASKNGMDIEGIKLLRGLQYKVDLSSFEVVYRGLRGRIAMSSSGTVKISGPLAPRLVALVERYLLSNHDRGS